MSNNLEQINTRFPKNDLLELDPIGKKMGHINRSETIRAAVRFYINEQNKNV